MKDDLRVEIHGFSDWHHYDQFKSKIEKSNEWMMIPTPKDYEGYIGPFEKWFKHIISNQIWRLSEPDPPSSGFWEKVG